MLQSLLLVWISMSFLLATPSSANECLELIRQIDEATLSYDLESDVALRWV